MKHVYLIEIDCSETSCLDNEKPCCFLTKNPILPNAFICSFFKVDLPFDRLGKLERIEACKNIFKRIQ